MARRGREARQAPAQPAPCASVAEHPAPSGHAPGAARAPSVLTTPQPVACREHEEPAERGTSDTPARGFQAPAETEAGSPIPVCSWETTRDVVHLRKHRNILKNSYFNLSTLPRKTARSGRLPIPWGNPASGRRQGGHHRTPHPHTAGHPAQTSMAGHRTRHLPNAAACCHESPFLQSLRNRGHNRQANPPWEVALVRHLKENEVLGRKKINIWQTSLQFIVE